MSQIFHVRDICTIDGPREVAGISDCACPRWLLMSCAFELHCGHCLQPVHRWTDGSLVGLVLTCADGVLTIRLADFNADLHRCGEEDTLSRAVDDVIEQITSHQVVTS